MEELMPGCSADAVRSTNFDRKINQSKGEAMTSTRTIFVLISAAVLLVIAGCGGGTEAPVTDPADTTALWPAWYSNPPIDAGFHLAAATATSQDPQLAIDKAELDAQARLATEVNTQLQAMMTRFIEEVGSGEDAQLLDKTSNATKRTTDEALAGVRIRKQETIREGNIWRGFVLAEVPVVEAQKALLGGITKDEEMYTRFRDSQAFQALEAAVGD